jgi:hypothetical protein
VSQPLNGLVIGREDAQRQSLTIGNGDGDERRRVDRIWSENGRARGLEVAPEPPYDVHDVEHDGRVDGFHGIPQVANKSEPGLAPRIRHDVAKQAGPFPLVGIFAGDHDKTLIGVDQVSQWHRRSSRFYRWVAVGLVWYDQGMPGVWIGIAMVVVAGLAVAAVTRLAGSSSRGRRSSDVDVGPVSEGWLSEHRARKDS